MSHTARYATLTAAYLNGDQTVVHVLDTAIECLADLAALRHADPDALAAHHVDYNQERYALDDALTSLGDALTLLGITSDRIPVDPAPADHHDAPERRTHATVQSQTRQTA